MSAKEKEKDGGEEIILSSIILTKKASLNVWLRQFRFPTFTLVYQCESWESKLPGLIVQKWIV